MEAEVGGSIRQTGPDGGVALLALLIDDGPKLHPLEIKSGETVNADFFGGLRMWRQVAGKAAGTARLVYGGDQSQTRQGIQVLPWRKVAKLAAAI